MTADEAREALPDARSELAADLEHEEWDAVANDISHLWDVLDAITACEPDVDKAIVEYNAAVERLEAHRREMRGER